jgi:hypothetical protein
MTCISDSSPAVTRDELGDLDETLWEPGLDGRPRDPWAEQWYLPLIDRGNGNDLFCFTARNVVSIIAVRQLLGKVQYNPKGRAGLYPVIKLGVVEYFNKRFNTTKPKPILGVIDWVAPDGGNPPASVPKLADDMNDAIGF